MLNKRIIFVLGILSAICGLTPVYADAPYTSQTTEIYEEQEYNQKDYQDDYAEFIQMYSNIDQQSVTAISVNSDQLDSKELSRVIKGIQAVSNSARNLSFKTPEGQQLQKDFIANNDFSIQAFKQHNQLVKDRNLQKQLSIQAGKLEQQLAESLYALKNLAEQ